MQCNIVPVTLEKSSKILKYILCRVVDPRRKVPDFKCEVQDLLLEVVDLKQEVPDLRSDGIPHNLTPGCVYLLHGLYWPY